MKFFFDKCFFKQICHRASKQDSQNVGVAVFLSSIFIWWWQSINTRFKWLNNKMLNWYQNNRVSRISAGFWSSGLRSNEQLINTFSFSSNIWVYFWQTENYIPNYIIFYFSKFHASWRANFTQFFTLTILSFFM